MQTYHHVHVPRRMRRPIVAVIAVIAAVALAMTPAGLGYAKPHIEGQSPDRSPASLARIVEARWSDDGIPPAVTIGVMNRLTAQALT